MKKIIESIFIPMFIAILCGYIGGKFIYKTYKENLYNSLNSSRLYLIEKGSYDDINTMREENSNINYVYYKDKDKYKSVVGITKDYNNVDKIKSLYSDNLYVYEYYLSNNYLDSKQDEYEKDLDEATDIYDIKEAVNNILNLYRTDEEIKLIDIG